MSNDSSPPNTARSLNNLESIVSSKERPRSLNCTLLFPPEPAKMKRSESLSAFAGKDLDLMAKNNSTRNYSTRKNSQNLSDIYINDEGDGGIEVRDPRILEDIPLPTDRSNHEVMKLEGIAGVKVQRGEKDKGFILSESMALVHAREILALSNR